MTERTRAGDPSRCVPGYDLCNVIANPRYISQGSVFAEFRTLADAQKFVDMSPQPEFQGQPVVSMFKYVVT